MQVAQWSVMQTIMTHFSPGFWNQGVGFMSRVLVIGQARCAERAIQGKFCTSFSTLEL
jgi:hypothetical protein